MMDAPERIWADMEDRFFFMDGETFASDCTEYIRADLAPALNRPKVAALLALLPTVLDEARDNSIERDISSSYSKLGNDYYAAQQLRIQNVIDALTALEASHE